MIRVTRNWAPNAADRFYNLVKNGFYDECRFFRVVPDTLVQFGINGDPAVSQAWLKAFIKPDRAKMTNTRGRLSFAAVSTAQAADQNTRATQVFINYGDNSKMDMEGFARVRRSDHQHGDGAADLRQVRRGSGPGPDRCCRATPG